MDSLNSSLSPNAFCMLHSYAIINKQPPFHTCLWSSFLFEVRGKTLPSACAGCEPKEVLQTEVLPPTLFNSLEVSDQEKLGDSRIKIKKLREREGWSFQKYVNHFILTGCVLINLRIGQKSISPVPARSKSWDIERFAYAQFRPAYLFLKMFLLN